MSVAPKPKLRVRFAKRGKVRFVSHRDVAQIVERALRKVRLPLAYSEGFSPRPKVSFGLALSVAHESDAEYFDVALRHEVETNLLAEQLTDALPDGITVAAVERLPVGSASLQQAITSCTWRIEVLGSAVDTVSGQVDSLCSAEEIWQPRTRKGKTSQVDIRPAIISITVDGPTENGVQLTADLATEKLSVRPDELVGALDKHLALGRVLRLHQWTTVDGIRCEPVNPPDLPSTRPDLARVVYEGTATNAREYSEAKAN